MKEISALQSWTTKNTSQLSACLFPQDPKKNEKKKKAFLLLLFWVFLSSFELKSSIPNWCKKLKLAPRAFFNTTSQGPRFNSNQAFLLVQKLKSDPSALTLT